MRADYCPLWKEPCQANCDPRCAPYPKRITLRAKRDGLKGDSEMLRTKLSRAEAERETSDDISCRNDLS